MFLTTQVRSQPDVCTEHKQCYLARNISAKISFFSDTQDILNIRTIIHGPAQIDDFIRTDIKNFPETTRDDIISHNGWNQAKFAANKLTQVENAMRYASKPRIIIVIIMIITIRGQTVID